MTTNTEIKDYKPLRQWAKDAANGKSNKIPYIDITDLMDDNDYLRAEVARLQAALEVALQVVEYEQRHAAELEVVLAQRAGSGLEAPTVREFQGLDRGKLYDICCRQSHAIKESEKCVKRYQDELAKATAAKLISATAPPAAVQLETEYGLQVEMTDKGAHVRIYSVTGEVLVDQFHESPQAAVQSGKEAALQQISDFGQLQDGPDHGDTVLRIQTALGCTDTGWISPDVILLRIEQLKASVDPARKVPAWATPGTFKQPGSNLRAALKAADKQIANLKRENLELTRRYEEQKLQEQRLDIALERAQQKPDSERDAAQRQRLHDIAIASAERWATAEFKNAKNLGAGGPGLANECDDMERAARRAIGNLASMAAQNKG
jgi:hypothetical protein